MDRRRWPYDPHAPPPEGEPDWVFPGGARPNEWPAQLRLDHAGPPPGEQAGSAYYSEPAYPPAPAPRPPPGRAYTRPGLDREPRRHRRRDARTPARPPVGGPGADDLEDADDAAPSSWLAVLAWTACYYLVPVVLFLAWAFTRSDAAPAGCLTAAGQPCLSPRGHALANLLDAALPLGGALLLAVLMSLVLRRLTRVWRASTVGFSAAVIGAGLATLVASAL